MMTETRRRQPTISFPCTRNTEHFPGNRKTIKNKREIWRTVSEQWSAETHVGVMTGARRRQPTIYSPYTRNTKHFRATEELERIKENYGESG